MAADLRILPSTQERRCDGDESQITEGQKRMKHSIKSLLVAAAMTGLLGATAIPAVCADTPAKTDSKDSKDAKDTAKAKGKSTSKAAGTKSADKDSKSASKDKNSCKGANGCGSADDKKN
jgi:hypothetical protein